MNDFELEMAISNLIDLKIEGDYFDFKEEWHKNNACLLHDIICLANNLSNRDAYLIIGVSDDCEIKGVAPDKRKNQADLLNMLNTNIHWAGDNVPKIYVKTIELENKEIDIIIVKDSSNTPFYLHSDYNCQGKTVKCGSIYTRKLNINTPKTATADIYDTELLWKRRFGLTLEPSQRAAFYLKDLKNWVRVDEEMDKDGKAHSFFYYRFNPDYTIHLISLKDSKIKFKDINDDKLGLTHFYLYGFCNISYHTDFRSGTQMILYYRDVPLIKVILEDIDECKYSVVPPEFNHKAFYIKESLTYLLFEFSLEYMSGGNYSSELKDMILRVVPIFDTEVECGKFYEYIKTKGFEYMFVSKLKMEQLSGEAKKRFEETIIEEYNGDNIETVSNRLEKDKNLVINFAKKENNEYSKIIEKLKIGKMLVDWSNDWKISNTYQV